jgi:hypothetical protein
MRPARLLQPLNIPGWKGEDINMDFIADLPLSACKFNSIWVIVDRLTKFVDSILVHTYYRAEKYAELYIAHILCLHGVPKTIIFDRGPQFIAHFWEKLHASLGTHLIHSLAYHPQTDGHTERVNYQDKWDKCLSLAEFSYNNSYQESLRMPPFEALYGRRCCTPPNWIEPSERMIFGPDLVTEAKEIVHRITPTRTLPGINRKAMPTKDVDRLRLKLATACIFTSPLREV